MAAILHLTSDAVKLNIYKNGVGSSERVEEQNLESRFHWDSSYDSHVSIIKAFTHRITVIFSDVGRAVETPA